MTWGELRYWIFRRGLLSGAILGGLLGTMLLPPIATAVGTAVGVVLGFLIGGAVAIGTGISLTTIMRSRRLNHPNHIVNLLIVCVLFISLNMLFTILLVGGTVAVYGIRSTDERISILFSVGIIPALLSAIPAIWYTPAVTDRIMRIQFAIDSLKQKLGTIS